MEAPIGSIQFAELVLPHLDAAYNLARWLTRDPNDASDVVQEAVLRALLSVDTYRGGSGKLWILTIVSDTAGEWLSVNRGVETAFSAIQDSEAPVPDITNIASESDTAETALIRASDGVLLDRLIAALPAEFRECLVLREKEHLAYREIAVVMGIPIGTVMSRLSRARRMIHRGWIEEEQGYMRTRASQNASPAPRRPRRGAPIASTAKRC